MNDIRTQLQTKLNTITDIECGPAVADDVVKEGTTYFSYELQETYMNESLDKNYTMEINITGRLIRKNVATENTIKIVDEALEEIKEKLKELNFKYSYNDISDFTDGCKKILVKANARYNEKNQQIII